MISRPPAQIGPSMFDTPTR